jgi:hypothetical protein
MRPTKSRFVTVCQQALIVGTAFAVLGPAADVVSLDVIARPGVAAQYRDQEAAAPAAPRATAPAPAAPQRAKVETAPVEPTITDVPVDEVAEESAAEVAQVGDEPVPTTGEVVETAPQKVSGYGAIGVTWEAGTDVEEGQIAVQARTRVGGEWSEWSELHYNAEEGPDAGSADARNARPGTDPLIIGDVDEVQTRVVTAPGVETPDLAMAVVDPGAGKGEVGAPAISTGTESTVAEDATLSTDQGEIALQAGTTVARPTIYSRAQWGANESLRRGSVSYGTIAAGFIHHTVNANDYTADQVPAMLRSIYAYHTKTKGWNDIGYNFVIDRFGRIWEGRYGGVDKAVVGAHTAGYNSSSFAASALGNFEEVQPSSAMLDAYARLYAWKLSLHGVAADDTSQKVGTRTFQAISGHRDAGSTACPGRYLYAQLGTVRTAAKKYQAGQAGVVAPRTGTPRVPDLAGAAYPDLIARRSSDGAAVVLPTGGLLSFGAPVAKSTGWSKYDVKALAPDLNRDGISDMLVRISRTGVAGVRPGRGDGTYRKALVPLRTDFAGYDLITPVGRFDRYRTGDVVARQKSTGKLVLFKGRGDGTFRKAVIGSGFGGVTKLVAPGDITGDGRPDLLARTSDGRLHRYNGDGTGRIGSGSRIAGRWNQPVVTGAGDLTGDGRRDLLVANKAGAVYVAEGNGTGGFTKRVPAGGSLAGLSSIFAAPVLGSAEPDAVGFSGDSLVVVPHAGRVNVTRPVLAGVSFSAANLVLNVGDWDGDGKGDVITRQTNGDLVLYRGDGTGRLAAGVTIDGRNFNAVSLLTAAGDVTGDKRPDLIGSQGGELVLYAGRGATALGAKEVLNSTLSATSLIGLNRWDGDGTLDTAIGTSSGLSWLAGGAGTPKTLSANTSGLSGLIGAGDVTGDGRVDLVGRTLSGNRLWMLPGTTTGFGPRRFLGSGFAGYDLIG